MSTKPTTTKQPKGKAKPKKKTKDAAMLQGNSASLGGSLFLDHDRLLAYFKRLTPEQKSKILTELTRGLA
jgi:hypothetical protein